ncbi:MAG: S8 family peptidase [Chitinophagaceae bacterium]
MRVTNQPVELIIETAATPAAKGRSRAAGTDIKKALKDAGIEVEEITPAQEMLTPMQAKAMAKAPAAGKVYVKTGVKDYEMNPWDVAHQSAKALGTASTFAEPDVLQEFVVDNNMDVPFKKDRFAKTGTSKSGENSYDPDWQPHKNTIWHLGDDFSQLKSAREAVWDINYHIRIGHLDTGYSKTHIAIPDSIKNNPLQRNFIDGEDVKDAHDRLTSGMLRMPGHGTGTLGILAGGKIRLQTDEGIFNDYLGGAPFAEVICCRVAPSVVLMKASAFAEAISYLTSLTLSGTPVHVVSMSMGGAPAKAWADAINAAYEAGITIVTAAGNNFNGLPTQHVIYPARFQRVIAACGVTHDYAPYSNKKLGEMQGCYGPRRHMAKALAGFTPNTPWATVTNGKISFAGAGTSSATPQVAAAAAIYYRKYYNELNALQPWQRVEAIRNALYRTALKKVEKFDGKYSDCFGNGIVQAFDALSIPVGKPERLTPPDKVPWFPILTTIFKAGPQVQPGKRQEMFNTELAQLVYNYPELSVLIDDERTSYEKVSQKKWNAFADAVIEHPATSITLKKHLMQTHSAR